MNPVKFYLFSIFLLNYYLMSSGLTVKGCGKLSEVRVSKRSLLVVRGTNVHSMHQWPWMAALRTKINGNKTRFLCGGSLITKKHVLTAAHCFGKDGVTKPASDYYVVMGSLKQKLDEDISEMSQTAGSQVLSPSQIKIHPGFKYRKNEDDIAIISLKEDVILSDSIKPVCLPGFHQRRLDFGYVSLAGWGGRSYGEEHSDSLQEATFKIVPINRCRLIFRDVPDFRENVNNKMICAGDTRSKKDACKGDSGGPLIFHDEEEQRYVQLGIVAFGYNCGEDGYPGLYIRLGSYLSWIENSVKQMN